MKTYLDLALQGRNDWWRFILALALIFFFWQIIGASPSVVLLFWVLIDGNPQTTVSSAGQFIGVDPILGFVVIMFASAFFLVGIFLAVRYIHLRPLRTLVTSARTISWSRFLQGFFGWFILALLMSLVEALVFPGRYVRTSASTSYILFAILALILIPIQTSAEELFFRGYVLQGFGLRLRNIWVLSAISGILFMLPHFLNPEARLNFGLMGFYYFFIGAVMAYVTLRDGRLELALGLHAANNLFTALFANYTVTALPTPSLFTITTLDVGYSVISSLIGLLVFVFVFIVLLKPRSPEIGLAE